MSIKLPVFRSKNILKSWKATSEDLQSKFGSLMKIEKYEIRYPPREPGQELDIWPLLNFTIGTGANHLIGIYGIHGDEYPAIRAFFETPYELLYCNDIDFSKVSYSAILANPLGVREHSRVADVAESEKIDMNRMWDTASAPYQQDLIKAINGSLEDADSSMILDHHSVTGWHDFIFRHNPFFIMPKNSVEYGSLKNEYIIALDNISNELSSKGYMQLSKNNDLKFPFKIEPFYPSFGSFLSKFTPSLETYLSKQGNLVFALETSQTPSDRMTVIHSAADIAALRYLQNQNNK
jgi:hypothetical protein